MPLLHPSTWYVLCEPSLSPFLTQLPWWGGFRNLSHLVELNEVGISLNVILDFKLIPHMDPRTSSMPSAGTPSPFCYPLKCQVYVGVMGTREKQEWGSRRPVCAPRRFREGRGRTRQPGSAATAPPATEGRDPMATE